MNGYTLANAFRTLRESWRFTSTEADLYYELVGIANERGWPAGFQYSNQLICATIGISEKSLIAARNRLKQAGLLDFVSGHKRAPTAYTLHQKGLPQVSKKCSKSDSISDSESDSPFIKELKQKENELQIKLSTQQQAANAARVESEKKIGELLAENNRLKAQPIEVSAPPVAPAPPKKTAAYRNFTDSWPPALRVPWPDPEFHAAWGRWATYLANEAGKRHGGAISEQADLDQLQTKAGVGGLVRALEIIDESIARGWKALIDNQPQVQQYSNAQRNAVTRRPLSPAQQAIYVPTGITDYGTL